MSTTFTYPVISKAIKTRPWVRKRGHKYRVVPRTADHGKYELTISYDSEGRPTVESCVDFRTGEECKGFKFNQGACYHGATLLIHLGKQKRKAA